MSPKFQKKHNYKTETREKKEKREKVLKVQGMTDPREEKKQERRQPIEKPRDTSGVDMLKARASLP